MLKQSTEMCCISTGPAGVTPPVLTVLNSTAIEVMWSEPLQTNGIIEYYLLEWADARREIRNFTQLRVVLDNLVPYTEYSITLAACTSKLQGAEVLFSVRGRGFVSEEYKALHVLLLSPIPNIYIMVSVDVKHYVYLLLLSGFVCRHLFGVGGMGGGGIGRRMFDRLPFYVWHSL